MTILNQKTNKIYIVPLFVPTVLSTQNAFEIDTIRELKKDAYRFWSRARLPWGVPLNLWDTSPKCKEIMQAFREPTHKTRAIPHR